jgi:ribokinase
MRVGVVGHVEWIEFVRVERLPAAGDIVHGTEAWQLPAGGGAVAAVQLARLAGSAVFFTAFGGDALGQVARGELEALGVTLEAVVRREPQRRGITLIDQSGERTITVLGTRVAPSVEDALDWERLGAMDGVYVTAGDADVIRLARKARVLVATSRILPVLEEGGVELDALVGSSRDPMEAYHPGGLTPPPRLVVRTDGANGGTFTEAGGGEQTYEPVALPGPLVDTYGCGDSFAAGLTYGLAAGGTPARAVRLAAACGASVAAGRGPFEGQLKGPADFIT